MKYRVYNKKTGDDITNNALWVVAADGKLYMYINDDIVTVPQDQYEVVLVEAEQKEAEWVFHDAFGNTGWFTCSNCDYNPHPDYGAVGRGKSVPKYCAECGAKMKNGTTTRKVKAYD